MQRWIIVGILLSILSIGNACVIDMTIVGSEQSEDVPNEVLDALSSRFKEIASRAGVAQGEMAGRFFLTGKFSNVYEDVLAGPPVRTALHTMLTIYIGDMESKAIYSAVSLDLRGVGTSRLRAYINALGQVNAKNENIREFIEEGKSRIIEYYDNSYPQLIEKAKQASELRQYGKALWLLCQVPECSKGWQACMELIPAMYESYVDYDGMELLSKASAIWKGSPNPVGARNALSYLQQIKTNSSAHGGAEKLMEEIGQAMKKERNFVLHSEYRSNMDLRKLQLQTAKEIAAVYASSLRRPAAIINWIH